MRREIAIGFYDEPTIMNWHMEIMDIYTTLDLREPILNYFKDRSFPPDNVKARKIWMKVGKCLVVDRKPYKKSYLGLILRCIDSKEAKYVLAELNKV